MSAIVIGASSGLGRALAEGLAARGRDLLLVASGPRDLEALAADLRLRHGVRTAILALDLATAEDPGAKVLAALEGLPAPTALLLPLGWSRDDDDLTLDASSARALLVVNLLAPRAIVRALLPALAEGGGTIVLFGSIAAVRGRGRNVAYAAAKRGLESLYESLRHAAPAGLHVQLWRLGFLATNLTFGRALPLAPLPPQRAASRVLARLGRGSGRYCLPWTVRPLGWVLRLLPWSLFRRMRH